MLVKYLRQYPRFDNEGKIVGRGDPIGCVVAVSPEKIGYTICCPKDQFDREYARNLAAGRALTGTMSHVPNRTVDKYFDGKKWVKVSLDQLLHETINDLKVRATAYFAKREQPDADAA